MALGPRHVAPELLSKVTKALGITALDQWYYVSHHAITKAIGARVLNNFGGNVASFLKTAYPQHQFDEEKLTPNRNQEREQKFIEVVIRKLFPNTEIHTKARKAVGIVNPATDAYLEIDFWMPDLKLGIEYQDKHHYGYQWYANEPLEDYQKRDSIKKDIMKTMGYTLITIGFWWDKSLESVAATIRKYRPDLLQEYKSVSVEPIPQDPPLDYFTASPIIPGVSGIMSPFVPGNNFNPANWYAGEKHDGIRGVYNPTLHKMFSRAGKEFSVLPSLLQDIPKMLIEGEIIAGRSNYNKTAAMSSHTHHDKVNWPLFRYLVFDIPDVEMGDYTQRYSTIISGLSTRPFIFAQLAFRVLLVDKAHLKTIVDAVISDSGEGVIVQQDAKYEYGRARSLAKIKIRRDADAKVLRVNKLSCTCKLASGITTEIIFCDDFNPNDLKVGDIISYYHNGYSQSGVPKQGEIYKIRYDTTWEKILSDQAQESVKSRSIKEAIGSRSLTSIEPSIARRKLGYWNKSQNVRAFFDEFARMSAFDPLVADNWYPIRTKSLENAGSGGLLSAYGHNLKTALTTAYPEVKFEAAKFRTRDKATVKSGHWNKPQNVRAFFDEFARSTGFDPRVVKNWYTVSTRTLQNAGGSGLLRSYPSFFDALTSAYPELKFKAEKFRTHDTMRAHAEHWKSDADNIRPRNKLGHWNNTSNVRAFFDEYARTAGFDPLVPANWYPIRTRTLQEAGGGVIRAYNSLVNALTSAYPELKFKAEKFRTHEKAITKVERGHWRTLSNVRKFFDKYARKAGFDPLVPENWYSIRTTAVKQAGGGGIFSAFHGLTGALTSAYPELKFEEKFRTW